MVGTSRARFMPLPPQLPMLLLLLLVALMTPLVSANPRPPTASSAHLPVEQGETTDQRDGRVWDMLRQESRSFISAILPDKIAAHTHQVLWSAPLHERAAREDRIPRYTVVAMAGPPMLQSHDTDLLDAALSPRVAGDFGRKANGRDGGRHFPVTVGGDDGGRRRPEMAHEAEQMPNALTTDEERGMEDVEAVQAIAGQFGQRGSPRPSYGGSIGYEAAPSAEEVRRTPAGATLPADIVSGLSSFPQTERVPYLQSVRDFQAEKKQESEQAAQPTSRPLADEFNPPAFEEFPFDSLKMDSSTGGGPEQAQFVEQETGNENSNEHLSFDTSNFPNFPTFSFPRAESGQDAGERPVDIPAFKHGGSDWFKQDQTGSQRHAEPETTRFPMFPGDQEPVNGEDMDSGIKDMQKSMESTEADQQDMLQEMMKEEPETTESPMMEELKSGDKNSTTKAPNVQGIANDGEITNHAGGLPLAPVNEDRNTKTPPTGPADNQFQNFKEGGAYPDLSLVGFPSFPDIPGVPESDFSVQGQAEDAAQPSDAEDTDAQMTTPQKSSVPPTVPPSSGKPPLGEFVYPDIFPEVDLSPTEGDEFYSRLEFDPTFQTPTAPDFSFSDDTRGPLKFPEIRTQFPLIETDFSHARPEFPELRTRFPQPEADFSLSEPEFPGLAPLNSEEEDAFQSFAEIAELNRDSNDDVNVFSDDEKMNDRRAINYHSPMQFGSRGPKTYNHFSKSSGDEFKNTFFKNDFTRVTTQRPTTTSQVPKPRRPQHLQRPHAPRHPQGPQRPYPYKPREPAFGRHTTTTTYRPAIFVNKGPKVNGEDAAQEKETPTTPSTSKPSGPAFFPHSGSIPGYIPRPTRPRPHHRQPARGYGQHRAPVEEPQSEQEAHPEPEPESSLQDSRKIPGYISRPTPSHRAPQGALGGYIRSTEASLTQQQPTSYELPTAHTPEEHASSMADEEQAPTYLPVDVSDMSTEDQPPTYIPDEEFSTTVSETAAPTAATTLETASPTSSDLTDPSTMPESPSTPLSTPPPTFPPTTQPPATRAATRRPYTFPPFRRSTTPASAMDSGDATTSQFAPEFGTKISNRRPESSASEDGARRRRPGGRRRPTGGASSGSGSRRRPGMRRRPVGGRRRTTSAPYTTTPAPVEMTTVPPVVNMADEAVNQQVETEQQMVVTPGDDQRGEMAGEPMEEQGLPKDVTEGFEAMPGSVGPMEDVGGFGQQEMLVDVMPTKEVTVALVPEETPAVEMPADEMIAAEVMPEEMGPVATVTEEVEPVETMQEEIVPVEMTQDGMMGPVEMIPEDVGYAAFMPAEMGVPEPNPEGMGSIPIMPVLSEVSQSTAEPMTMGAPIVAAPINDISGNTDIYVPPSSEISEGETPAMLEMPGGIFELQPAVPQTQEGVDSVFMLEGEKAAASSVTEASPLGEVVDVRDATERSDALRTVQDSSILEEEAVGPTPASELREFAVEENTLGGFGTFPEAEVGDSVDVSAVLREELGDDVVEEDQVDEVNFPVTSVGPGDNFFTEESLQSLDDILTPVEPDTGFGPFSGPSALENNKETIVPSSPPQQEMIHFSMPDGREQGPEMTDIIPHMAVLEAGMPNTESQEFGMPETAPSHMMNGMPMVENNGQYPGVFASAPTLTMSDAPVAGTSSGMPEIASDMPPHMAMPGIPMQEFDSNVSQIMEEIAPEMVATTLKMEDDMMVPHSMMPEMSEGEQQNIMPADAMPQQEIMPGMLMPEDAVSMPQNSMPMPQDATPMPQNIMPFPHDSTEKNPDEMGNRREESPFSSDMAMSSHSQTLNAPIPTFVEPEKETTESMPEGFWSLQAYSVMSESEEPASDGGMMPDMTNSAADGFQGFQGSEPEEAPVPAEDHTDMAGDDTIVMPDSDDFMPSEDFDIRGSFDDGISTGQNEGEFSEATIPDQVFGANPQPDMPMENAPEVDLHPEMMAQPTSETVFPDSGSLGSPVEIPIPETDSIETRIINQGYYPPEAENQQSLPEESSMDAVEMGDAPIADQSAGIVDEPDMNEQPAGIDVRITAESQPEEAVLASAIPSATESGAEVVEMGPEQYVYPSEERAVSDEADLQGISSEEGQEQGEERQDLQEAQEEGQEQGQERQEDLQEGQEEGQEQGQEGQEEGQEQGKERQAEYQEIQEQELVQEDQEIQELVQDQEIQEQEQELVQEDQEAQEQDQELVQEDQEIQEQEQELFQEDQEQRTPPPGYGPPHSDTIVADAADDVPADVIVDDMEDDVTEDDDVTAPVTEGDILQAYEAVPYEAVSQAYEADVKEQPAL